MKLDRRLYSNLLCMNIACVNCENIGVDCTGVRRIFIAQACDFGYGIDVRETIQKMVLWWIYKGNGKLSHKDKQLQPTFRKIYLREKME
jgi:hypothetical protein